MCKLLKINRSNIYYKNKVKKPEYSLENAVIEAFNKSRKNYGTRKIKVDLQRQGIVISRRKIGVIMKKYHLISKYTLRNFKNHNKRVNNSEIANIIDRKFDARRRLEVVISDLTYVKISGKWAYICLLIDLSNREIISYSCGFKKNAELVSKAFYTSKIDLSKIEIFHTDRGSEFDNAKINNILRIFNIKRSLSKKGCPYDNAVSEAVYSIVKTEFVGEHVFASLEQLEYKLFDYINWYNNSRIHSSLGYCTPKEFEEMRKNISA